MFVYHLTQTISLITLLTLAAGCAQSPPLLPTRLPTAAALTAQPTGVAPASRPTERPGATRPSPTAAPASPAATTEPTGSQLTILTPHNGAALTLGTAISVTGILDGASDGAIQITLLALDGRQLAQTIAPIQRGGAWQTTLEVPPFVAGPAQIQARPAGQANSTAPLAVAPIQLALDASTADRYLVLDHPRPGEAAIAGYYLYFDGFAHRPFGRVSVALLADDCQNMVARQSYQISGGYWQAFLAVPPDLSGPTCAIAYSSDRGAATWREVQLPITMLPTNHPDATAITIIRPDAGNQFPAGAPLQLYGLATNIPGQRLLLRIETADARLLTQEMITIEPHGYWQAEVRLPHAITGPAQISLSTGEAETQRLIEIVP